MPWTTPTLQDVRGLVKSNVTALLRSGPMIANSVLRVMSDANAGLAYLTLLYLDWLAKQLLPDKAEDEWLIRHANIWLPDGPKVATFAIGVATVTGIDGTPLAIGAQMTVPTQSGIITFVTTQTITVGPAATPVNIAALTAGVTGLETGASLSFVIGVAGVDGQATVSAIADGVDAETDDELRVRVLDRIRKPPMGGDADDYVQWALQVPAVTRAWSYPLEMGIGTVTVRFMMDDLRAGSGGFPNPGDVATVDAHMQIMRPVAIKDYFTQAPIPYPINVAISNLDSDDAATRAAITASLLIAFLERSLPGQTWYRAWTDEAIAAAAGVDHYDLTATDTVMASNGYMPTLGTITYS